jgi:hypothetical protein
MLMSTKRGHVYKRYHSRKYDAKRKGLVFDITMEYVLSLATDKCPILGIELSWCIQSKTVTDNSPSLDRVIPHKGYIVGNVVWISSKANRIKNNGTMEEHRQIADFMERFAL